MVKKLIPIILIAGTAFLVMKYVKAPESKKRFIKHLVVQIPYLPGRYYA